MATQTPNLNLTKPMGTDYVRIGDFNDNADKLDVSIGDLGQLTTDAKASLVLAINEAATKGGANAPYIGENGNWFQWNATLAQYEDTEIHAEGPEGPKGDKGDTGDQGPKGDMGTGLDILGTYTTLIALEAAVVAPAQGDVYNVGAATPYTIYMWDETTLPGAWVSQGQIEGPKGDKGEKGDKGDTGGKGDKGDKGEPGRDGLSEITDETDTTISGVLVGEDGKVRAGVPGQDFAAPTHAAQHASGGGDPVTPFSIGAASYAAEQIANRIYDGVDLTAKFAAEINANPYYGDVWAWIKARIQAANFAGLHVGDYIPFVAGGNIIKAEIGGMDTYFNYGDTATGHHIDFISRDCWPDTHVFNKANYNNGTTVSPHPWLASDLYAWLNSLAMQVPNATTASPAMVAVDYSATGVYDKLPAELKAVIVPKRVILPTRYTAGSLLTDDNSWAWIDIGKLWVPSEIEVYGCEHWGGKNGYSSGGFQQYPVFATNMKRIKGAGDGGARAYWWLLSALGGSSTNFAYVSHNGYGGSVSASAATIRAPLCFRIA